MCACRSSFFTSLRQRHPCFAEEHLLQLPFFRQLSQQALQDLVRDMDILCLQPGEVLIRRGEENHCLYLLLSGRLEVHLDAEDSTDSMMVEPGECVGEMSIIEQCPTSAWVIGHQPSTLLVMTEGVFWERFVVIPGVLQHLLQILVRRMRAVNDRVLTSLETRMQYQILHRELEYAGRIQASLLPHSHPLLPNHPQVEVSALMQPATQVGGDFFDALALDRERIAVAVGDISGKGIPAALLMARVVTCLRMNLMGNELAAVMPALNSMMCQSNEEAMFATVLVVVCHVRTGHVQCVSAGHPPPFFARRNAPFEVLPVSGGVLTGVVQGVRFAVDELVLGPGDSLVLYTDGVTEARNQRGGFFGEAGAKEALNAAGRTDVAGLVRAVKQAVDRFATGVAPSDDITLLGLRYKGGG